MRPQQLIDALRLKEGLSVAALAEKMASKTFQGTLHRYLRSTTTTPEHSTAERITRYFKLPLEAVYDARVATRIARERGLIDATDAEVVTPLIAAELSGSYRKQTTIALAHETMERIALLKPAQLAALETTIDSFLSVAGVPKIAPAKARKA